MISKMIINCAGFTFFACLSFTHAHAETQEEPLLIEEPVTDLSSQTGAAGVRARQIRTSDSPVATTPQLAATPINPNTPTLSGARQVSNSVSSSHTQNFAQSNLNAKVQSNTVNIQ